MVEPRDIYANTKIALLTVGYAYAIRCGFVIVTKLT